MNSYQLSVEIDLTKVKIQQLTAAMRETDDYKHLDAITFQYRLNEPGFLEKFFKKSSIERYDTWYHKTVKELKEKLLFYTTPISLLNEYLKELIKLLATKVVEESNQTEEALS